MYLLVSRVGRIVVLLVFEYSLQKLFEYIRTIRIRDGHGPGGPRAGAGRAGPENPGPWAVRAETGLKFFI